MTHFTLGIIFLTLSAITHASWNFIAKRSKKSSKEFFFLSNTVGLILFLPILFFIPWREIIFPHIVWMLIVLVGLFESFYFVTLSKAYSAGELSIVYPIVRSFPVIFALLFGIFYYHRMITLHFSMGCIMTVIGCFISSMQHFKDFALKKYISTTACFAYVTALLTAGYMISDNHAIFYLQSKNNSLNFFEITIFYALIRNFSISALLGISIFQEKKYRENLKVTWQHHKNSALLAGLGMCVGYTLILLSMTLIHHVVYIILFRQVSVPLAVLLGIYFAHEPNRLTKWIGIITMVGGIVLASV